MARKNKYNPQVHPVNETMNTGTQTGKLTGKLNVASLKQDSVPSVPIEPIEEILIIDGNADLGSMLFDGNLNA